MSDTNVEAFKEMEERLKKELPKPTSEDNTSIKAIPAVVCIL